MRQIGLIKRLVFHLFKKLISSISVKIIFLCVLSYLIISKFGIEHFETEIERIDVKSEKIHYTSPAIEMSTYSSTRERNVTKAYSKEQNKVDFDLNLPLLRKMIVRISTSYQFPSNFTNPEALYSNDVNSGLFTNLQRGSLNVYTWMDMFSDSIDFLKSKLEYPYNPWKKSFTTSLIEIITTKRTGGRIFGYILPRVDGTYSFEVKYIGSIELWISPDALPSNAVKCESTIIEEVCYFLANLKSGMKQYIEIIYASEKAGVLEVRWKEKSSTSNYEYVDPDYLIPFVNDTVRIVPETYNPSPLPLHTPSSWMIEQFHPFDERNTLFSLPHIDMYQLGQSSVFASCDYKPAISYDYKHLKLLSSYPATTLHNRNTESRLLNAVISKELKERVLSLFMESISDTYPAVHLSRLVNMERLNDEDNGDLFLVEVMVTLALNPSKEYLLSHFVVLGHKDYPQSQLCHPNNLNIRRDTFVHILVTHRNLPHVLREFVQNMEQIYDDTGDDNFGVIIVNYVIPQFNVTTLLRQSRLKHWSVIDIEGPWQRTGAINLGIDSVKSSDEIIYATDLFLFNPPHILDNIRQYTFQGYSGFSPIIFFFDARFKQNILNKGFYSTGGFGLFCLYKSDWSILGGMDSMKFKEQWGGEDIDFATRALRTDYLIFRMVVQDCYHQPHSSSFLWDFTN